MQRQTGVRVETVSSSVIDDACIDLWARTVATRDGVPESDAVRDRARGKFTVPRIALVVARSDRDGDGDRGRSGDGDRGRNGDGDGDRDGDPALLGFALVTEPAAEVPDEQRDAAYLSLLAVRPGSQGRGTGRALLGAAVAAARAAGWQRCLLHALEDNARALELYRSAGFRPVGEPSPHALSGRPVRAHVAG